VRKLQKSIQLCNPESNLQEASIRVCNYLSKGEDKNKPLNSASAEPSGSIKYKIVKKSASTVYFEIELLRV
jgi:hypothetical protein